MKHFTLLLAAVFGVALTADPAAAQQTEQKQDMANESSFQKVDTNNNDRISKDEFYGYVGDLGVFSSWDSDRDGLLDENEYNELGLGENFADYDAWDDDNDGFVDATEAYDHIFSGYDADESGHWENGEWDDAGDAGLFDV